MGQAHRCVAGDYPSILPHPATAEHTPCAGTQVEFCLLQRSLVDLQVQSIMISASEHCMPPRQSTPSPERLRARVRERGRCSAVAPAAAPALPELFIQAAAAQHAQAGVQQLC